MSRRVKRFRISPEAVAALFKEDDEPHKVTDGLPEDAELVRIRPDSTRRFYWFVFESSEFDRVEEGCVIPEGSEIVFESVEVEN